MTRGEIYRRLGVEPIVNANATETILGGSLMRPEVVAAMVQAADSFVDLVELEARVGERLARLTRNEAAFVCGGAASGLFLTAAACMTRGVEDGILRLEDLAGLPLEFIIHPGHHVPYLSAIELVGGVVSGGGGAALLTVIVAGSESIAWPAVSTACATTVCEPSATEVESH